MGASPAKCCFEEKDEVAQNNLTNTPENTSLLQSAFFLLFLEDSV